MGSLGADDIIVSGDIEDILQGPEDAQEEVAENRKGYLCILADQGSIA